MSDYLTQPTSESTSVIKARQIRDNLKKAKDAESKKSERFAKKLTGLGIATTAGKALLKNSLERYNLRNQDQLNTFKANQTRAKDFITNHKEAIKNSGTLENFYFNKLKDQYADAASNKAGLGFAYSSADWDEELNADVANRVAQHKKFLQTAYDISETDIDKNYQAIASAEMPSTLFEFVSRPVIQRFKKETPETLTDRKDKNFKKLIERPTFSKFKDFQAQAKVMDAMGGNLNEALKNLDEKVRTYDTHQIVQSVQPTVVEEIDATTGQPKQVTKYTLSANIVSVNKATGYTEQKAIAGLDGKVVGKSEIVKDILPAVKMNAMNELLGSQGMARLTQLLDQEPEKYALEPEQAFFRVIEEGNEKGLTSDTKTNPYLEPDIDETKVAEAITTAFGKAFEPALQGKTLADFQETYPNNPTKAEEEYKKYQADRLELMQTLGIEASMLVKEIVKNMKLPTVLDGVLPPPSG